MMIARRAGSCVSLCVACLFSATTATAEPKSALDYLPADRELAVCVRVGALMATPLLADLLDPTQPNRLAEGLESLAVRIGIDPRTDVDAIYLTGNIGHGETYGLIAEGRINQGRVSSILQGNELYKTYTIGETTVHQWFDRYEWRTRHAVFLDAARFGIWNSREALAATLAAASDPMRSMAGNDLAISPAERQDSLVWGILQRHAAEDYTVRQGLNEATLRIDFDPDRWITRVAVRPVDETYDSDDGRDFLRSVLAHAHLQPLADEFLVTEDPSGPPRTLAMRLDVTPEAMARAARERIEDE